jgi:hypothetical protein
MSTYSVTSDALVEVRHSLSQERLQPYVAASQGNHLQALDLYAWNIKISGAFYEVLSIAEVWLRNSLHHQLTRVYGSHHELWFDNRHHIFSEETLRDISTARKRASRPGSGENTGRVIAELNFGFWKYILAKRYETSLWTPALRHGFPGLHMQQRKVVFDTVTRLHALRNRIAHHEPIYQRNLSGDAAETFRLIEWISADTRAWTCSFSRINDCLRNAPVAINTNR